MQTENTYVETDLGNIALNPRGEYSGEASYEYLDIVSYMGGSYVCLAELTKTISGIAPAQGENTEHWQMLTLPGQLTPEAVAMHDDVFNKAKQVETSRAAVELSQQEVEAAQADVTQMRQDTQEASEEAIASRDSAAGYAQSAEASRTAAKESEDNINAQVTRFDTHVAEKTSETESAITEARRAAVSAVSTKQDDVTQAVIDEGDKQIKNVEDAGTEQAGKAKSAGESAVSAAGAAGVSAVNAVKAQQTASIKAIQEAGENALQNISNGVDKGLSEEGKAADAKATGEAISKLTEDLSNKITKFYASNQGEINLRDSNDGKIMDMMLYGRSEQKQYRGKNLLPTTMYSDSGVTNGVTFINNGDGSVTVSGTATDITYFSLWGYNVLGDKGVLQGITPGDVLYVSNCLLQQTNSKEIISTISNGSTQFKDSTTTMYVAIRVNKGESVNKTFYPQIEKGSEATSYEPYVGGQPSPSPNYPQKIKSVVNPTVKVCGKNLWNPILGGYISNADGSITANLKTSSAVTDFIKTSGKDITVIARNFSSAINNSYAYRIGFYDVRKKWIKNIIPSGGNKYSINTFHVTGTEYIRVSAPFGIYDTIQIEKGSEATPYEPYTEQSVQLPYTLNAIPVTSGGNVTIDGQQYVADYVDIERGKLVRMCERKTLNTKNGSINEEYRLAINIDVAAQNDGSKECIFSTFEWTSWGTCVAGTKLYIKNIKKSNNELYTAQELKELSLDFDVVYQLLEQQETDLTTEQTQALKELATYYPVTNISVNSEQLDGYTVFNYPVSMANGWNYVKQQLNDNRDYIYDMDLQSAEAYVNGEYAVTLTELEV